MVLPLQLVKMSVVFVTDQVLKTVNAIVKDIKMIVSWSVVVDRLKIFAVNAVDQVSL